MAVIKNEIVIQGNLASGTLTHIEPIKHQDSYAVQIKYSSNTAGGTAKLQASIINKPIDQLDDSDFIDVQGSLEVFEDASGSILWSITSKKYTYMRLVLGTTSGTTYEAWVLISRPKSTE